MRAAAAYGVFVLLHLAASATVSPATGLRKPSPSLDSLGVDFVVDILIEDVDDEDEDDDRSDGNSAHGTTLCIAPPCGVKAAAILMDDTVRAPLPWILGLKPPEAV